MMTWIRYRWATAQVPLTPRLREAWHSDGLQRMTSQKQALDSVDTEPPKVPRCDTQVPGPSASVGYGEFGSDTGLRNGPNM